MSGDELKHYSRALDEIHRLRVLLAYEASVVMAQMEGYSSTPKGVREVLTRQAGVMLQAATGCSQAAAAKIKPHSWERMCNKVGPLTREQWEAE